MNEAFATVRNYLTESPDRLIELVAGYGTNLVFALLIFLAGRWLAGRLVTLARRLMSGQGLEETVVGFIANILYVVLLVLVVIATLSQLGIPTASFIAVIGAAGLAIGLALQGSLSNFASGVLLVSMKPLKVGDYVEAGGVSGTVDRISIFSTRLIAPDQRVITVPNSSILGDAIVNYSTSDVRKLELVVGIGYDDDIDLAKRTLRALADADDRVLQDGYDTQIGVVELGDSSVKLAFRPWVRSADYWPLRFDLLERVKTRFDELGIGIPYPQIDVHLDREGDKASQ